METKVSVNDDHDPTKIAAFFLAKRFPFRWFIAILLGSFIVAARGEGGGGGWRWRVVWSVRSVLGNGRHEAEGESSYIGWVVLKARCQRVVWFRC